MECVTSRWPRPGKFKSAYSLTRMRPSFASVMLPSGIFQSTHSLTECDTAWQSRLVTSEYFNPRIPSQECDIQWRSKRKVSIISIHALPHRMRQQKLPNFFLFPSISYPYCTPPLSKTQPLYFHRTIFPHKLPIFQCESFCIFMST